MIEFSLTLSWLWYTNQLLNCVASILHLQVKVLHFFISALEFSSSKTKLVSLRTARDGLWCASLRKITFTEESKCDVELWLEETIKVFAIDVVNSFPFNVNEAGIAHNNAVISQFQIDRHLFRKSTTHGSLSVFRRPVDQLKPRQVCTLENFLDTCSFGSLQTQVV